MFNFTTNELNEDCLLFFIGDNVNPHNATKYMYLALKSGRLHLVTQIHFFLETEEVKIESRIILGENLNDLKWHQVEVVRSGPMTNLTLDSGLSDHSELGEGRDDLSVGPILYVGGIPARYKEKNCGETFPEEG